MATQGYDLAKFPVGSKVRIADKERLREFRRTWTKHHKLSEDQVDYGGTVATVLKSLMYHGGNMLYELDGIPGIWHERLLESASSPAGSLKKGAAYGVK